MPFTMILLIDPEVSYLDVSQTVLEARGYDVVTAEDDREIIRLGFDFKDEISAVLFDSSRIEKKPELLEALRFSERYGGTAGTPWIEWSLPFWPEIQQLELRFMAVSRCIPSQQPPLQQKGKPQ